MSKLPPLPEPKQRLVNIQGQQFLIEPTPGTMTFDEARSYGQACWEAALEAAAKACADVPIDHVFVTTIAACASAIRSMKEPQ